MTGSSSEVTPDITLTERSDAFGEHRELGAFYWDIVGITGVSATQGQFGGTVTAQWAQTASVLGEAFDFP